MMKTQERIRKKFEVKYDYSLYFSHHIFSTDNNLLADVLQTEEAQATKVMVVVDDGVALAHPGLIAEIAAYFRHHADTATLCGEVLQIEGGETAKNNFEYITTIVDAVDQHGIDRHSFIIAIGGGAVLDAVGFAAAISHRGVRHIRVPTTVLSQDDSGVGVKNGINHRGKKNFIGSFAVPHAILNDTIFLSTLSDRDWRSGISEAIKVALIKDRSFFTWICENVSALKQRDLPTMNHLIYRCAEMHMEHIATTGDPFEQGSSRPLDFGHWAAHKLEQRSNFEIRHGEAVAIGIALDATYSYLIGLLEESALQAILDCINGLGLPLYDERLDEQILIGLDEFREHLGGKLTIMLLEELGKGIEVHVIDHQKMVKAIEYISTYTSVNLQAS